jgi:hypothetical protein
LIAIDNILVSDLVVEEQFVCDLKKCKGGCCEEGDAGAPLEDDELNALNEVYENVKPYLSNEGIQAIEQKGRYHYHKEFGWVTPTIENKICAYGSYGKGGIIKCGIEQAYYEGKINWKKPISCHLYPIKIKTTKEHDIVNYEPRDELCNPGCALGKKMKIPVYVFLKEALIRKYGEDFYAVLEQIAEKYFADGKKVND